MDKDELRERINSLWKYYVHSCYFALDDAVNGENSYMLELIRENPNVPREFIDKFDKIKSIVKSMKDDFPKGFFNDYHY